MKRFGRVVKKMGNFVPDFLHASILVFGLLILGFLVFCCLPVAVYTLFDMIFEKGGNVKK